MIMEPLKTLKGSKIWYSRFGVGKRVGSKIYMHINSRFNIIPGVIWNKAVKILEDNDLSPSMFYTLCYDFHKPFVVRFDTCDGFLTEREPVVGDMVYVDTDSGDVWSKYNPQIYHHKWLWVPEGFLGFDVKESYEWSKHWLSKIPVVASGYPHKWKEQLERYNLL